MTDRSFVKPIIELYIPTNTTNTTKIPRPIAIGTIVNGFEGGTTNIKTYNTIVIIIAIIPVIIPAIAYFVLSCKENPSHFQKHIRKIYYLNNYVYNFTTI